ncbi:helix-turn-helix domain-containing protein [Limnoglobus roseus]|uniref:XRE family transcriptional regulator n=1 Tax=Limnoglobus roseus TaxID=2598579 RepID=A0A5C1AF24_9BACT|nr:helix-turn-helix transcriptional regulator [Limnoglobus roseus]QEL15598.1 XRE family transcriptional regulator [Limnoglobus roseus]
MPFSGLKLREVREGAGVEREQLANDVGTSKQYISHLENGIKKNPAFDLVEKLAAVLGVDCREFVGIEPDAGADASAATDPPAVDPPKKRGRPKKPV